MKNKSLHKFLLSALVALGASIIGLHAEAAPHASTVIAENPVYAFVQLSGPVKDGAIVTADPITIHKNQTLFLIVRTWSNPNFVEPITEVKNYSFSSEDSSEPVLAKLSVSSAYLSKGSQTIWNSLGLGKGAIKADLDKIMTGPYPIIYERATLQIPVTVIE